jgi:peptidoglycan hydrolase CwlO-like protein
MKLSKKVIFLWLIPILLGAFWFRSVNQATIVGADDCVSIVCSSANMSEDQYLDCNKKKQECLEKKIDETQEQAVTLTNTINLLNGQISLQQLQVDLTLAEISKLEKQVVELSERIKGLGYSLDRLSTVLIERVQAQYKQSRVSPNLQLLGAESLTGVISKLRYLSLAQQQTADIMARTETQRLEYDEQKQLKEQTQEELELKKLSLINLQASLKSQKSDQQFLLGETKNNEAKYQAELAKTLAELEAIQSIIAGRGAETKIRKVDQGDKIASIIAGPSACSTGAHLHFEVARSGTHRDPAGYLKPVDIAWNNSPDGTFSFTGSWEWPVNNAARITQGYGMTYYARVKRFYGGSPHTGIDILSKTTTDYTVKAVQDGTLYRGSIPCGGGLLRYVKVEHEKDSSIATYYLHINY